MKVEIKQEVEKPEYINLFDLEPNKWYLFENRLVCMLGYLNSTNNIFLNRIVDNKIIGYFESQDKSICKFTSAKEIKSITIEV